MSSVTSQHVRERPSSPLLCFVDEESKESHEPLLLRPANAVVDL